MGISQQIGASSIIKPGVIDSAAARPASPYEGQMVYQKDTDQVFVWNGTAWLYSLTPQTLEAGAWQAWTPTMSATSGTFTTVTVNLARYTQIQKLVIAKIDFTITTIGTATGLPRFTLPVTSATTSTMVMGSFRETSQSGFTGVISYNSTTAAVMHKHDNSNHLAASNRYEGTFTYEAA
jgi:hypothetical protein